MLTKKVPRIGRQLDGLYVYGNSVVSHEVCYNSTGVYKLWHARLGHPAAQAVRILEIL